MFNKSTSTNLTYKNYRTTAVSAPNTDSSVKEDSLANIIKNKVVIVEPRILTCQVAMNNHISLGRD